MATVKGGNSTGPSDVAVDQVGGEDVQRVKLTFGDGTTATRVSASDPLPVTGISVDLPAGISTEAKQDSAITLLGTIDADTGSIAASASALAGAVSGTEMQVDVLTMPTVTVQDGGGSLTVDGTVAVTGTFWQATQPVSAASLPLPSGAATAAKQPALGTAGTPSADVITVQGATSMTPLKVDGSGVTQPVSGTFWQATQPVSIAAAVAVTDNGGSLTVDGTVAATQSGGWTVDLGATDNAVLDAIAASLGTLDNAISGNEMQVDIVGSLPSGSNAIGKLAANSGVDIGDVDVTSIVGTGTNAAGQATISNTSATIVASGTGRRGVLLVNQQTVPVYIDPSGGTATTSMFRLDPGASVVLPSTTAITGITSAAYSAVGDAKVHYMTFA